MAIYRFSAVEQGGIPLVMGQRVPNNFSRVVGLMRQAHIEPIRVESTETIEITPEYWLPDSTEASGIDNPYTDHRFFLTSVAKNVTIHAVPFIENGDADIYSAHNKVIVGGSNRTRRIVMPSDVNLFIIGGQSPRHGSVPCLHEVFMDL